MAGYRGTKGHLPTNGDKTPRQVVAWPGGRGPASARASPSPLRLGPHRPCGAAHTALHQATVDLAEAKLLFRKTPTPTQSPGRAPDPSGETTARGGLHVTAQAVLGGGKEGAEAGQTKASGSGDTSAAPGGPSLEPQSSPGPRRARRQP